MTWFVVSAPQLTALEALNAELVSSHRQVVPVTLKDGRVVVGFSLLSDPTTWSGWSSVLSVLSTTNAVQSDFETLELPTEAQEAVRTTLVQKIVSLFN